MISLRMGSWSLVRSIGSRREDEARRGQSVSGENSCVGNGCEKGMHGRVNTKLKTTLQESASITVITYRSSMENAQALL
jgi:hypothetical protein